MKSCKKCGSDNINIIYIGNGESVRKSELVYGQSGFVNMTVDIMCLVTKEHLVFACDTCGYEEADNTIDNKK